MTVINLDDEKYTKLLAEAPIYAKRGKIKAVQVTDEGLRTGQYASRDVRYDGSRYVIDTYEMKEVQVTGTGGCIRTPEPVATTVVEIGQWIVTAPKAWQYDRDCNYLVPAATFERLYAPTVEPGVYHPKGMVRAIPNDTGDEVEALLWRGGAQTGDKGCYICEPFHIHEPRHLAESDRFLMVSRDFALYGPADEVLGVGWQEKLADD